MAEFTDYFDSGVLVKIYQLEAGSREAARRVRRAGLIPLPFLAEMEMRNALRVLHGRNQLTEETLEGALSLMDADIVQGRLARTVPDSARVASTAERLSRNFSAPTLCRTLDLLHVSLAVELEAPRFHTGDKRQAALARKAGLRVSFLGQ
ncbi:MAG: type II toxin-antitoxin system VapC family toxin [Opitutales bacterium]|nr:type II toxin-antitoxin system VapC family toxin [Opitutales bacterium]